MNNLYSCEMSKFSPTKKFKWIDFKDIDSNKYNENSSTGCVLEDDLDFPKNYLSYILIILYLILYQKYCLNIN